MSAAAGALLVFVLQLVAALLTEKEILSESMIKAAASISVIFGAFFSSLFAGGKIYGIISSAFLLLLLFLEGAVLFTGKIEPASMFMTAASAAAGAALGTVFSALKGKK